MSIASALDTTGNPAPLGLLGFGMTTILLNFHNAGFYPLDSMILAMGIFYGGLAQIIVGLMEWKKGNTFGTTAFTSYGLFWISLVTLILLPKTSLGIVGPDKQTMAIFLAMWGLFTLGLFVGTLRLNKALQVVFGSLVVLYFLLAVGDWYQNETVTRIAGWEGVFCGATAIYAAFAQILNEMYGKVVLPLGPVKKK
ncbi:MAG: acetate uptake transporter [Bdellovibrionales bacterium]